MTPNPFDDSQQVPRPPQGLMKMASTPPAPPRWRSASPSPTSSRNTPPTPPPTHPNNSSSHMTLKFRPTTPNTLISPSPNSTPIRSNIPTVTVKTNHHHHQQPDPQQIPLPPMPPSYQQVNNNNNNNSNPHHWTHPQYQQHQQQQHPSTMPAPSNTRNLKTRVTVTSNDSHNGNGGASSPSIASSSLPLPLPSSPLMKQQQFSSAASMTSNATSKASMNSSSPNAWRKHGKLYRATLVLEDDETGGHEYVLSNHCSIDRYYRVAEKVMEQFIASTFGEGGLLSLPEHYNDSSSNINNAATALQELSEAYLVGHRLVKFLSVVLPTHPEYSSHLPEKRRLRTNSQEQLVQLMQYMEQLTLKMDELQYNRFIFQQVQQKSQPQPQLSDDQEYHHQNQTQQPTTATDQQSYHSDPPLFQQLDEENSDDDDQDVEEEEDESDILRKKCFWETTLQDDDDNDDDDDDDHDDEQASLAGEVHCEQTCVGFEKARQVFEAPPTTKTGLPNVQVISKDDLLRHHHETSRNVDSSFAYSYDSNSIVDEDDDIDNDNDDHNNYNNNNNHVPRKQQQQQQQQRGRNNNKKQLYFKSKKRNDAFQKRVAAVVADQSQQDRQRAAAHSFYTDHYLNAVMKNINIDQAALSALEDILPIPTTPNKQQQRSSRNSAQTRKLSKTTSSSSSSSLHPPPPRKNTPSPSSRTITSVSTSTSGTEATMSEDSVSPPPSRQHNNNNNNNNHNNKTRTPPSSLHLYHRYSPQWQDDHDDNDNDNDEDKNNNDDFTRQDHNRSPEGDEFSSILNSAWEETVPEFQDFHNNNNNNKSPSIDWKLDQWKENNRNNNNSKQQRRRQDNNSSPSIKLSKQPPRGIPRSARKSTAKKFQYCGRPLDLNDDDYQNKNIMDPTTEFLMEHNRHDHPIEDIITIHSEEKKEDSSNVLHDSFPNFRDAKIMISDSGVLSNDGDKKVDNYGAELQDKPFMTKIEQRFQLAAQLENNNSGDDGLQPNLAALDESFCSRYNDDAVGMGVTRGSPNRKVLDSFKGCMKCLME